MKNIAVLVSGGGTNLQAMIDAAARGEINNGRFCGVIASKDGVYALERAKKAGIPTQVLPRAEYKDVASYTAAIIETLNELEADLVVYAGFMTILDEQIMHEFAGRMMNVHPSLIPSFCGVGMYGLHVHEAALSRGVKLTGATVHFVNEVCDGGPIILQKVVEVKDGDTPEILQRRVMEEAEWHILPRAVDLFCRDKLVIEDDKVTILP